MRLLVVTRGLEPSSLDPATTWVRDLAGGFASRGHRVTVLCTEPPAAEGASAPADPVEVRRPGPDGLAAALELALDQEPDVVHLAAPGALSADMFRSLEDVAQLVDLVDWSPICPASDLLQRPLGVACDQNFPAAPCSECVGPLRIAAADPFMTLARSGLHLLAHSSYARDRATLALGRGVTMLPVGVDARRFSREAVTATAPAPEVAALAAEREQRRVVLLGPPAPARGGWTLLDLLVALQARVPGVEFVVAGRDPGDANAFDILRTEARELGIEHQLRLLPDLAPADLPALLAACDVGLAPGLAPDPLGLPLVQALAIGLPVVAHPAGAAPELLLQGEAGVLADASQVGTFADQVAELLGDAPRREALGEQGRLTALERHDLDRAVYDTEALYDRVRLPRARRVLGASAPPHRRAA